MFGLCVLSDILLFVLLNRCFAGSSLVHLENGVTKRMRDLAIGDQVLSVDASGKLKPSAVYLMPHAIPSGMFHFKRISTSCNYSLTITPDHYMLVADRRPLTGWKHRNAVPAANVRVGDRVWVSIAGEGLELKEAMVTEISDVFEEGLFAPFTLAGNIVSDNIVASVYVDMFGSESLMHSFCAWVRALWVAWPGLFVRLHSLGWLSPISMAVAHMFKAMIRITSS